MTRLLSLPRASLYNGPSPTGTVGTHDTLVLLGIQTEYALKA